MSSPQSEEEDEGKKVTLKTIDKRLRRIEKMLTQSTPPLEEVGEICPECGGAPTGNEDVQFQKRIYKKYVCGKGHIWVGEA